ncbi:MAG: xylulokinase [Gammaproteobacteria bacterium]|nr:xylulokinase [Gammaproteobacteria bacterium]
MYLGIDLGTSSVKIVLMNDAQDIIDTESSDCTVSRPHDSWSEQDPAQWIDATRNCLSALKQNHAAALASVRGIGLSGQQHGATLLGADDEVLRPCILWNDTRATAEAETLNTPAIQQLCGSIVFPGFTAPKVLWVKENEPELFKKCKTVLLPKDYLRLWLTGEKVSEMSDASGTGWLDVARRDWSDELMNTGDVTPEQMPSLVEGNQSSGTLRAAVAEEFGLPASAVVAGGAGDNAASACGMGTVRPGSAFLSLGTSGVLFAANESYKPAPASAVHTFCHSVPDTWHQMGVILSATDSLNWLSGITGQKPSTMVDAVGTTLQAPGSTTFLPYLGGERTPHNNAAMRGALAGIGHDCDAQALTRAVLEGVSFAFRDNVAALALAGTNLDRVAAVGGGSRSRYWLQLLATVLNMPVDITVSGDFGAGFGAARLGMMAADGSSVDSVCTTPETAETFEPAQALVGEYNDAYERFRALYPKLS